MGQLYTGRMRWLAYAVAAAALCACTCAQAVEVDDSSRRQILQHLYNLPRFSLAGMAKADLGHYELFKCKGGAQLGTKECEAEVPDVTDTSASGDRDPAVYVQSLAMLAAAPAALAVLYALFGCCFIFGRYCCCCIKGGTCGKRYPVPGQCGFSKRTGRYSIAQKVCAYSLMIVFVAFTTTVILLGNQHGNVGISSAMVDATERAPAAATTLVKSTPPFYLDGMKQLLGVTMVQGMRRMNHTVMSAVDLPTLIQSFRCAAGKLQAAPSAELVLSEISSFEAALKAIPDQRESVGAVDHAGEMLHNASQALNQLNATITEMRGQLQSVRSGEFVASVEASSEQLTELQALDSSTQSGLGDVDEHLPRESWLTGSGGIVELLDDLLAQGCQSCSADHGVQHRDDTKGNLADLEQAIADLPDLLLLADQLDELNSALAAATTRIDAVVAHIDDITAVASGLVPASRLNADVTRLVRARDAMTFDGVRHVLQRTQDAIDNLPSLSGFRALARDVAALATIVDCVTPIFAILDRVQSTLLDLPGDVGSMLDMLESVNSSAVDATRMIAGLEDTLDDVEASLDALPDIAGAIADLTVAEQDMLASGDTLNTTGIVASYEAAQAQLTASYADARAGLSSLADITRDAARRPSAALIAKLRALPALLAPAASAAGAVRSSVMLWESGYCVTSVATPCSCDDISACRADPGTPRPSTSCPAGGLCNMQYAAAVPSLCIDDVAQTCSSHSECEGDCRVPQVAPAVADITALADETGAGDEFGAQKTALAPLGPALANVLPMTATLASARSLHSSVQSALSSSDKQAQFASIHKSLQEFNIAGFRSGLSKLNGTRSRLSDLREAERSVGQYNSTLHLLDMELFNMVEDYARRAHDFVTGDLHIMLHMLSAANLQRAASDGGLNAVVHEIADAMELAYDAFNMTSTNIATVRDTGLYFRRLERDLDTRVGPLAYLLSLVIDHTEMVISEGEHDYVCGTMGNGDSYAKYAESWKYPYCFTRTCIRNGAAVFNKRDMSVGSCGAVPTSTGRELVTSVPYILPALFVLMGLLAMVMVTCPKFNPAICVTCCSFCVAPVLLVIFGALLFPLVVAFNDMCYGSAAVASQAALYAQPSLCNSMGGQLGPTGCTIAVLSGNVTVDAPGLAANLLGSCDDDRPVQQAWTGLARMLRTLPLDMLNETVFQSSSMDIMPKGALKDDMFHIAHGVGNDTAWLVQNVSSRVLTCSNLNGVFTAVRDTFCVDAAGPIAWMVTTWYLAALAMVMCGCMAGICGHKRFTSRAWGPAARKVHAELLAEYETQGMREIEAQLAAQMVKKKSKGGKRRVVAIEMVE